MFVPKTDECNSVENKVFMLHISFVFTTINLNVIIKFVKKYGFR